MPEPKQYTAGEVARLTILTARLAAAISTGRGVKSADAAIERLQANAIEREQAEERAAAAVRQKKIQAKADKRAARGWF